uniref:NADH dehydrogenase subunit 6 n=1 Tax=Colposcenia ignota TaxID=3230277 RepID=A0AAU8G8E9_9HEMI
MLKIMLFFMLINSWLFSLFTYPIPLGFMIMCQTLFTCIFIRAMTSSSWLTMTMFLIMVGGLMIIFLYMTSISSNNMMKEIKKTKIFFIIILWYPISMMFINFNTLESLSLIDSFNKEFLKMFSSTNYQSSMFLFVYLLVALVSFIKIMNLTKGPMRKKY